MIKLSLTDTALNKLKKLIKKVVGLSICQSLPEKILNEIKNPDYSNFFRCREIILKFEMAARDSYFPIEALDKKIHALIGAWAFSNHVGGDTTVWRSDSRNMSIESDPMEDHFIIVKSNKIIHPLTEPSISSDEKFWTGKKLWRKVKHGNLKCILDSLSKKNSGIGEVFETSLGLYFEAISEKRLEFSFLKFWIVTERILKQGVERSDRWICRFLKKLIKERHMERVVDCLYKKRNDIVHEFQLYYISQHDRNLAKEIAETAILILINLPSKIDNIPDLKTYIDDIYSKNEVK